MRGRSTGCQTKKVMNKIAGGQWGITPHTPKHASARESEFQEWEGLNADFLPINKRSRNIGMSPEPPKELVYPHRADAPQDTWQSERFRVHQSNHIYGFNVVAPHH